MDFLAQSLPEAAYLYTGLALQALTRGALAKVPGIIAIPTLLLLIWRAVPEGPRGAARVVGYFFTTAVLLVLFWPEAAPTLSGLHPQTNASRVASYAAQQHPGAPVITAAQTGLVPPALSQPVLLPHGLRLLLQAFTNTHLALATAINSQAHRPFSPVLPMQWLLTQKLDDIAQAAIRDFAQSCYLPVQTQLLTQGTRSYTFADLLPWGGSPLEAHLATLTVAPGAQTGLGGRIQALFGPIPTVPCDVYVATVEEHVQRDLLLQTTQAGTPLSQVFQTELGLSPADQARFLLYREMLAAAGPAIPAPSLAGQYLALLGVRAVVGVGGGAGAGALTKAGALAGAGLSAVQGVTNELQRALDGIVTLTGIAVFLTWWGPYILGLINLVVLGLFPFAMIWSLFPQAQFRPLATYFATLLVTTAAPLWWSLVDVAARLAQGGILPPFFAQMPAWANNVSASLIVTSLGVLLIPVVTGLLIFGAFRGIGGLWRSFGVVH